MIRRLTEKNYNYRESQNEGQRDEPRLTDGESGHWIRRRKVLVTSQINKSRPTRKEMRVKELSTGLLWDR